MEHKFTPGPWSVIETRTHRLAVVIAQDQIITEIRKADGPNFMETAALLAAAPELLGACEKLVEFGEAWQAEGTLSETEQELVDEARAAIAKALPETTYAQSPTGHKLVE